MEINILLQKMCVPIVHYPCVPRKALKSKRNTEICLMFTFQAANEDVPTVGHIIII